MRSLYVHLPFCRQKCLYCDFPVVAAPVSGRYLETLGRELELIRGKYREADSLETLYFGGGTPTLLSIPQLQHIVNQVKSLWTVPSSAEVSMECDPGTLTFSKAQTMLEVGVTRVSLGAQILDDQALKTAGRGHDTREFWRTVEMLLTAGYRQDQLGVDLIVGLPGVAEAVWEKSVREIIGLSPGHVSTYFLTLEENTPFHKRYIEYKSPLPSESSAIHMYTQAHELLTASGYTHYEISNYAKPGKECRHSLMYWSGHSAYLGAGLGAASYIQGVRLTRPRRLSDYYRWVNTVQIEGTAETELDAVKDRVMYQLRRAIGVDLDEYATAFGQQTADTLQTSFSPLLESGVMTNSGRTWRLTVPAGFLVSSEVLSDLFLALERNNQ